MNPGQIKYCPCTLAAGYSTYSPVALRLLFNGKKVSHILDFDSPEINEEVAEQFRQNSKHISVSGAQFKQSLLLDGKKLRLTQAGEQGHYILKPVPVRPPFAKAGELPANEHLTMQIARQVYGISTAECALIFFKNGEPAYITKRFDRDKYDTKIAQEDFASLLGASRQKSGDHYRFMGSYEDIASCMKKFVPAYAVEVEKYFESIVFNYLFHNVDAHLKNFSLQQRPGGDYLLSPAYDLVDTSVHISSDSFFALDDSLFANNFETESFKTLGYFAYDDFYEFGLKIGVLERRLTRLLDKYRAENVKVNELTSHSFLSAPVKQLFIEHYKERLKMLNTSHSKKI